MSIAILGIGVPGSGKTTVLKPFAEKYGLEYVNKDDIREEMLGDARDQSRNREIWEEANRRACAALTRGHGVVLDGTYAEAWKRHDTLSALHEYGATQIIGVIADVPLEVAQERNKTRSRVVPEHVIEWMHQKLEGEPPRLDEGFDALITLDELSTLEKKLG